MSLLCLACNGKAQLQVKPSGISSFCIHFQDTRLEKYLSYIDEVLFIYQMNPNQPNEVFCLYQMVTKVHFVYSGRNSVVEASFTSSHRTRIKAYLGF